MQVILINIHCSLIPKKLNHMMYHMKILHNQKIKMLKIKLLTYNVFQRTKEFMTYKKFSSHMKQLNNEFLIIFYTKISKTLQNLFILFLRSGAWTRTTFTLMCII
jgi:hypothetical protein